MAVGITGSTACAAIRDSMPWLRRLGLPVLAGDHFASLTPLSFSGNGLLAALLNRSQEIRRKTQFLRKPILFSNLPTSC